MTPSPTAAGRLERPRPTGHARKTAGHYAAAAAAGAFAGLPEGAAHPKQLLEPLRRCGNRLPFPREALATLEVLLDHSRPSDWAAGGRPLVFPSNAELAGCLGRTVRTVQNHLRALEAGGAIAIHRGPGNRRTPLRGLAGEAVAAFGIDLAPLAALAPRLAAVAAGLRERRLRLKRLLMRLVSAVQELRTAADAVDVLWRERPDDPALGAGLAALKALAAEGEAAELRARALMGRDACDGEAAQAENESDLARLAASAEALAGEASALAARLLHSQALGAEADSRSPASGFADKTTTEPQKEYSALQESEAEPPGPGGRAAERPRGAGRRLALADPGGARPHPAAGGTEREEPSVRPAHVLAVLPDFADILRDYLFVDDPAAMTPAQLRDGGRILALRLGVSDWCWRGGCAAHGPTLAALAAVVAAARPAWLIRKSRAAFLAGMLLRPPGELNALASFHALRKGVHAGEGPDEPAPRCGGARPGARAGVEEGREDPR
ncbi:MAG TPA: helix-turn-helix domain-containing protein [Alphaproteobacteria bacterium]|nr:helix-turn-helix domain-containing protein [Alphaproteobacteria bacterium]